jgi:hypothetical protein
VKREKSTILQKFTIFWQLSVKELSLQMKNNTISMISNGMESVKMAVKRD